MESETAVWVLDVREVTNHPLPPRPRGNGPRRRAQGEVHRQQEHRPAVVPRPRAIRVLKPGEILEAALDRSFPSPLAGYGRVGVTGLLLSRPHSVTTTPGDPRGRHRPRQHPLTPWVNYIVPALEAMVTSLCETTGYPRIRVVQALKEVYERVGTNDYAFAIQESPIFQEFHSDFDSFNALVIEPAKEAFARARRKYLVLYPGAREGLDALRALGIKVVGLTDSPRNSAEARVRALQLDERLDALYTLPRMCCRSRWPPASGASSKKAHYRLAIPVVELRRECEKPSGEGLSRVIQDLGLTPSEVVMVGDNRAKGRGHRSGPRTAAGRGPSTGPTSRSSTGSGSTSSRPGSVTHRHFCRAGRPALSSLIGPSRTSCRWPASLRDCSSGALAGIGSRQRPMANAGSNLHSVFSSIPGGSGPLLALPD